MIKGFFPVRLLKISDVGRGGRKGFGGQWAHGWAL